MSEDKHPAHVELPVLPSSGKVEELKRGAAGSATPQAAIHPKLERHLNSNSLVSRFVDPNKSPAQKAIEEKAIDAIRLVYDPEIPVNIYDLGLIYGINVNVDKGEVYVKMTLTAPGCPVAGELVAQVQRRVEAIEEVKEAVVELVWDPPWSREMMSEAAQLELGLM
jgi:FeS assembly SUF system protein